MIDLLPEFVGFDFVRTGLVRTGLVQIALVSVEFARIVSVQVEWIEFLLFPVADLVEADPLHFVGVVPEVLPEISAQQFRQTFHS